MRPKTDPLSFFREKRKQQKKHIREILDPNIENYEQTLADLYKQCKIDIVEARAMLLPQKRSPLDVAADIHLPKKFNNFLNVDLEMTPYLKAPVSLIGDPDVFWIFVFAPTQSGKSLFSQIVVADTIDQNPGSLIYAFPTENDCKKHLNSKLGSMIKESPFLRKHLRSERDITQKQIDLINMIIYPAWDGSGSSLDSTTAKIVILDELRNMRHEIGKEGSAVRRAEERTTIYRESGQAQCIGVTSPAHEDDLAHAQIKVHGTTEALYHWKCATCGKYYYPDFFKTQWYDVGAKKPIFRCIYCKSAQPEGYMKSEANKDACYGPRSFQGATEALNLEEIKKERMIFRWNSQHSPFRPFKQIYNQFKIVKNNPSDLRAFKQTWNATFVKIKKSKATKDKLGDRIDPKHSKGSVPKDTMFLTAGVDVQGFGFVVTVRAWLYGKVSYIVDCYIIEFDFTKSKDWELARDLLKDRLVDRIFDGWKIAVWGIDVAYSYNILMKATASFKNCMRVFGAKPAQARNIRYSKTDNHYLVKKEPYLEETDEFCVSEKNHTYVMEDEWYTQYCNIKKSSEINKKGYTVDSWVKTGEDDWRRSDTYAFAVLDYALNGMILRDKLSKRFFTYNPLILEQVSQGVSLGQQEKKINKQSYFEEEESYSSEFNSI